MSYDPPPRMPPRQERWPSATPAGGLPSYRNGDAYEGDEPAGGWYEADRQSAYQTARQQAGYRRAAIGLGDGGYQADGYQAGGYQAGGYHGNGRASGYASDDFAEAANGYGYDANGYSGRNGYSGTNGYGYNGGVDGYAPARNGYAGTVDGYPGAPDGYGGVTDGFDAAADGYGWAEGGYGRPGGYGPEDGYGRAADGYVSDAGGYVSDAGGYASQADEYEWEPNGYGNAAHGYAAGRDDYPPQADYLGPASYTEYTEPESGDPRLMAPDAAVHPDTWQAEQDSRREERQRGMMVGGVAEVLGTAVVIGVSTLAAGLVKAQTSPIAAMGSVFIDHAPATLRNALLHHFGTHGRTVLLLGMYAAIAVAALVIGVLARREAALGVAGIAAFTLFAAFVVVTRPASHLGDITPAIVGGIAGVAALLWLVRASAPITPLRHTRGGARRRTR